MKYMSLVAGFMFIIIIIPKVQYLCTVIEKQDMPLYVPPVCLSVWNTLGNTVCGTAKEAEKMLNQPLRYFFTGSSQSVF